ncbi:dienelactone hydrolase family protein [Pseudomarimonas arenosa]|uniref:Dienelactone hydrolase family protein n=1 Tax=Pseudomarimonas arenosa TaxID=2774145 RepID=A0AAW3ZMB6_9GAMM|nr:dienelactone hydrolase family protein [Pseudomarimonas arenosa]MBD8526883.1 dienelactone hydrolase family protein [Pseudomarimonas arenosa]
MAQPTHHDFDPQVLVLFDAYVHGELDRRGFLQRSGQLVGAAGALSLLGLLSPKFVEAQQVAEDDPRLLISRPEFDSPSGYGRGRGYLVRPAQATGALPLVLVIHENRGLNPHIEDVARRVALHNHVAFAPDALFPLGGYPGSEDEARAKFATLDQSKCRQDFLAAAAFARQQDGLNGKLGAVGFCYGGAMVNFLATELGDQLQAAVPFYGGAPALDQVKQIRAELLIVLAADDPRVNASWPSYQEALDQAKVTYQLFQPADTVHGFHNDTTPRFAAEPAAEAWKRTLALFERTLR